MNSLEIEAIITEHREVVKGAGDVNYHHFTISDASGSASLYLIGATGDSFKPM